MKDFLTIKEVAKEWNITTRRVQKLCAEGRIDGAVKFGRDWAIPSGVKKPLDERITTGQYRDWRKKTV